MGEAESKSRDLGSDRGYRVALLCWGDVGAAVGYGVVRRRGGGGGLAGCGGRLRGGLRGGWG
jgi:hypothetical protein